MPSGWPSAIAPPFTFSFASSKPIVSLVAIGTEAKASLTSQMSMSSALRSARARAFRMAGIVPSSMIVGFGPATAVETSRARGSNFSPLALSGVVTRTPHAPSLMPLESPAVIRPSGLNAAGRDASFSSDVVRRGCSSVSNIRLLPLSSNTGTGSISFLKRPSSIARIALRWDQSENSSICSRVTLYLSATMSAEMPCCTISYFSRSFGLGAPASDPSGTRTGPSGPGRQLSGDPPRLPIGVRTAPTITASGICSAPRRPWTARNKKVFYLAIADGVLRLPQDAGSCPARGSVAAGDEDGTPRAKIDTGTATCRRRAYGPRRDHGPGFHASPPGAVLHAAPLQPRSRCHQDRGPTARRLHAIGAADRPRRLVPLRDGEPRKTFARGRLEDVRRARDPPKTRRSGRRRRGAVPARRHGPSRSGLRCPRDVESEADLLLVLRIRPKRSVQRSPGARHQLRGARGPLVRHPEPRRTTTRDPGRADRRPGGRLQCGPSDPRVAPDSRPHGKGRIHRRLHLRHRRDPAGPRSRAISCDGRRTDAR